MKIHTEHGYDERANAYVVVATTINEDIDEMKFVSMLVKDEKDIKKTEAELRAKLEHEALS